MKNDKRYTLECINFASGFECKDLMFFESDD